MFNSRDAIQRNYQAYLSAVKEATQIINNLPENQALSQNQAMTLYDITESIMEMDVADEFKKKYIVLLENAENSTFNELSKSIYKELKETISDSCGFGAARRLGS